MLSILVLLPISLQTDALTRHVVRSFDNGSPYVVVYTKGEDHDRVKEELFYENGQLDYVGHYKNGREHGKWIYYWENGNLKSEEYYFKGKEEGVMYDYDENGKKSKEYRYVKGVLVSEKDL